MVKMDSGLRRTNMNMLAKLRNLGIFLYPGVPNTISATQETDRNYGELIFGFILFWNKLTNGQIRNVLSHNLNSIIIVF